MKKIIILGGGGYLGYHLAKLCLKKNMKVICYDLKLERKINHKNFIFKKGSILDKKKLYNIIKKKDIVFHFAAIAGLDDANKNHLKTLKINIEGTINVLETCIKNKAKKIIYSSSIYARSKQGGFYSTSKLTSELLIERYHEKFGINYNILRFGSLYGSVGNKFNSIHKIIKDSIFRKKIIISAKGNEIRNYIHVNDAVKICLEIISNRFNNRHFNLIGRKKIKIKNVVETIANLLKIKKYTFVPKRQISHNYIKNPNTLKINPGINKYPKKEINFLDGIKDAIYLVKNNFN